MEIKKDEDRYFRTPNLGLSIFLFSKNGQICGINKLHKNKVEFVFVKSDWLDELIHSYRFPEKDDENLLVDVHKHEYARRYLLDRMNEN